jgi:hypothetical protein
LDWKQGKIGVGQFLSVSSLSASFRLLPGGGSGRYPVSAIYNITLYTSGHPTTPNTLELKWNIPSPISKIKLIAGAAIQQQTQKVRIMFTQNVTFKESMVVVQNGKILLPFSSTGYDDYSGYYFCETIVVAKTPNVPVRIYIPPEITSPFPCAPSESTFVYSKDFLSGEWGPLVTLRDKISLPDDPERPSDGWYVAPIHANYVASLRKVLLTGWIRRDGMPCAGGNGAGGRRRAGVTWLMDPTEVICSGEVGIEGCTVFITPIDEDPEVSFETPNGATEDGYKIDGDVMYCAGHTTLQDGRIFFIGGGRYYNISQGTEREWGLSYGRLFDPRSQKLTRVPYHMPLGRSWYPTGI